MTAHIHDPATRPVAGPEAGPSGRSAGSRPQPWWLVPAVVGALVVAGLVVAGVVSASAVLYAGLFGGMILMHAGGHGHGGHGGGADRGGHPGHSSPSDDTDLISRSSRPQPPEAGLTARLDERGRNDSTRSESHHDDQHSSHGCH